MDDRGRGKVILLGEHSVVYGRPALAAALESGAAAVAHRDERDLLAIAPWGLAVAPGAEGDDPLARAFAAVLAPHPRDRPALRVDTRVELPGGAGLGCSAALGVAVIRAVDRVLGVERSDAEVVEASLAWERVFHGNPSGLDGTMAVHGGVALFRRGEPPEAVRPRRALQLVVGHSGEVSSTRAMVEQVARQRERAPERVDRVFDAIAAVVRNGRLAVERGDLRSLGQLFDVDQKLLNTLMVSTARLEELCEAARGAGALGAKLTGAGGGGCMIALIAGPEDGDAVRRALEAEGAETFAVEAGA